MGWTIIVVGRASFVNEVDDLVVMAGIWLQPWAPGRRDHFVRIRPERVTGRRLHPDHDPGPGV
ncbi:hypothetical protein [Kutzneria buriramensis]|uniref:Uncharacterized protein n=1 Tax=Kutzneria buriramensis TaxID=1045776 RepID=A0A3E0GZ19_9PSEU|nr:hypothetical protein [Kutzneria buriramensis]REH34896.1 hypothetical protein BCF44_119172 [Kutzneria buriramensis]